MNVGPINFYELIINLLVILFVQVKQTHITIDTSRTYYVSLPLDLLVVTFLWRWGHTIWGNTRQSLSILANFCLYLILTRGCRDRKVLKVDFSLKYL